jgi:hypothetical protein
MDLLYNRGALSRRMRYSVAISLALLSSLDGAAQQLEEHTIKSNVEYRLTRGDLPKLSFGIEKAKNVEVTEGGEELLQSCLNDPVTWSQDPLLFRLAHTHAASIQSCRENRSPSMHVIFLKTTGEPFCITRARFRTTTKSGCMKISSDRFRCRLEYPQTRQSRLQGAFG